MKITTWVCDRCKRRSEGDTSTHPRMPDGWESVLQPDGPREHWCAPCNLEFKRFKDVRQFAHDELSQTVPKVRGGR